MAANERYSSCYNLLLQEQRQFVECSKANKSLSEQSGRMYQEMHGLATTNLSLRDDLERAHKTIETSQKRNLELEGMLENIPGTGCQKPKADVEPKVEDKEERDENQANIQRRKLRPRSSGLKVECD